MKELLFILLAALLIAGCAVEEQVEQQAIEPLDQSLPAAEQDTEVEAEEPIIEPDESIAGSEQELELPTAPQEPEEIVQEFSISADEKRFDPATITVKKGSKVVIVFDFDDQSIYFVGLDIRSDYFEVEYVKGQKDQTETVEFIADESFTYTGYWPRSGTKKASGNVVVE